MKIAIMGIRGIPANYGGFETFIENLAPRLVERGHDVTVYGRSNIINFDGKYYKGVRIKILPTISHKYFDTVVHTFICAMNSFFTPYDVVFICNSANAIFAIFPRLMRKPVVLNVDGLEWKRQKWNWAGKSFYKISEFLATFLPNEIVTDAHDVQRYYREKFHKDSTFIPYYVVLVDGDTETRTEKSLVEYPYEEEIKVSKLESILRVCAGSLEAPIAWPPSSATKLDWDVSTKPL